MTDSQREVPFDESTLGLHYKSLQLIVIFVRIRYIIAVAALLYLNFISESLIVGYCCGRNSSWTFLYTYSSLYCKSKRGCLVVAVVALLLCPSMNALKCNFSFFKWRTVKERSLLMNQPWACPIKLCTAVINAPME